MRRTNRIGLLALTLFTILSLISPVFASTYQGQIKIEDAVVNADTGIHKLLISFASAHGVKGFSTKLSFDYTKIQPVSNSTYADVVDIYNESNQQLINPTKSTPFKPLAQAYDSSNEEYVVFENKAALWKVIGNRACFKYDMSTTYDVVDSTDFISGFEFYFRVKDNAILDSQTFRLENTYKTDGTSFLYAYIANTTSYGTTILDAGALGNSFYGKADGSLDSIALTRLFNDLTDLNNEPPLTAPSIVLTANPNGGFTATITDSVNNANDIEGYTIQLYSEDGTLLVDTPKAVDKTLKTLDISLSSSIIAGTTYTAKVKAEAIDSSEYSDSVLSALCAPIMANYLPFTFNYTGGVIPAWKVGVPFAVDFSQYVSGGKTPYTYSVPFIRSDVSLDSNTGILSGTPLSIGNPGGFTVTVTDAQAPTKTDSESISYAGILKGDPLAFSGTPIPTEKTYGDTAFELGLTYDGLASNVNYALVGADDAGTLSGKTITITKAGVIVVQATGTSANYETKVSQYTIIVQPKAILVTADSGLSKVYGTVVDPTFTYTHTPLVGSDSFTGTLSRVAGENVNAYDITIGNLALNSNYILNFVSKPFTVTPLELTYTLSANNKVYNGTPVGSGTVTLTNKIGLDDVSATGIFTFADTEVGNGKVVTVSGLTLTGTKAGNYTITDPSATLNANITPLELTYTLSANNKVYNGTSVGSGTVTLTNKIGSDDVSASGTFTFGDAEVANGKVVTVSGLTLTGAKAENYTITDPASTLVANITKATYPNTLHYEMAVVSATSATKTYNLGTQLPADLKNISYTSITPDSSILFTGTPTISSGILTFDITAQPKDTTGTLTVVVSNQNYNDVSVTLLVKVTDVNPDWTPIDTIISSTSYTYGDVNGKAALPSTGSATAGSTSLTGSLTYKDATTIQHAGSRVITVLFKVTTPGEYFNVEIEKPYTITINPKPITVVAENKTRPYGEPNPALTYTYNSADLVAGDSVATLNAALTLGCVADAATNVGNVDITGLDTNANDDYVVTVTKGTLTVSKATINTVMSRPPAFDVLANVAQNTGLSALLPLVTTASVQVEYGNSHVTSLPISWAFEPATVFNIKGAVYKLNGTLDVGTNFNTYTGVYQATLTVNPITGTLTTVVPNSVTIAEINQTNATTYADFELPASLTYTLDQSIGSTTYTAPQWDRSIGDLKAIPVETSLMVTLVQSADSNSVPVWLTIAPLTITVNVTEKLPILTNDITITDATITYGDAFTPTSSIANGSNYGNPVATYSFVDAQNQVLTEQPKNVGTYDMIVTYESATHKGFNKSTFVINPKPVTVIIEDKSRAYNVSNPALTWVFDTGFSMIAGETSDDLLVTLTCPAVLTSPAGTPVNITGTSTNTNYLVTFKGQSAGTSGILTITKSPMTALTPTITTIPVATPVPIGYVLIATVANVADSELTWEWYHGGVLITGETNKTYTLVNADSNQSITVKAVAKETNYSGTSLTSVATQVVKVNATGTAAVQLKTDQDSDGVAETGDVLTVVTTLSPVEANATSRTYQWKRNNVDISGATAVDYTLTAEDAGKNLSVIVTLSGDFAGTYTSLAIEVGKILLTGNISIGGNTAVGDVLTATLTSVPGVLNTDYGIVWLRDGQTISGATSNTYTLVAADLGKTIDAKVVAKGTTYSGELLSAGGIPIPAVAPSAPSMSGYAGDKLITVNWTEPANGGSPITHYVVQKDADDPILVAATARSYTFNGLTNGTKYTIKVSAVNVINAGPVSSSDFTPQPPAEDPYVPPTPPAPPTNTVPVTVGGESKPVATTETTETPQGTTQTTITTTEDLTKAIQESTTTGTTVSLAFTAPATTYTGVLTASTVKAMEEKEAVLEVKTETATYTLPAQEVNIQQVSQQIGTDVPLEDIKISVTISEPPADTVKVVQDTANTNNYTLVVQPVQFQVTATYEEQVVQVSKFTGYVERTIAIPDGVDPAKITTAVVLNDDGSFTHVPTTIVMMNGKYYAKINSLTNSTYTVIYNEVTFADTEGHWAENVIQDMGSRLIVSGVGNGKYEPNRQITRAEFSTILVRALGLREGTANSKFPDVTNHQWYSGYVQTAVEYGLITGYQNGNFGPNDAITREQAMTMIARAMKLTKLNTAFASEEVLTILGQYADGVDVSDYAKLAITACVKHDIVSGRTLNTLAPKEFLTRAEVAVIVQRLLKSSNLI